MSDSIDEKVRALEVLCARLEERTIARDHALVLFTSSLETYKTMNNEWRGALNDSRTMFITKVEASALMDREAARREALEATVTALEKSRNELSGKSAGFTASWGIATGLILMVIALIGVLLKMGH
jgi:GH15 family glucan-1,4-alpha-glucosidase